MTLKEDLIFLAIALAVIGLIVYLFMSGFTVRLVNP